MDIETAGTELYSVALAEFTARRTALARAAKQAGDTELAKTIGSLRKPTTSAWVVNMLARHRPELIDEIAALGDELRDAQDALDASRLRELGKQRSALVRRATDEAAALAEELGAAASASVREEVAQTLQTAVIEADAAALVATGTLVRPLTAEGWGLEEGGDVIAFPTAAQRAGRRVSGAGAGSGSVGSGAAASTKVSTRKRRSANGEGSTSSAGDKSAAGRKAAGGSGDEAATRGNAREAKREAEREQAQRALDDAEAELADAREEAERLQISGEAAAERRSALRDEVQELTRQLQEAQDELADVEAEVRSIRRSRDEAKRTVTAAERALARARRRLD